jgi:superoxide dismutase, Fe-Mn family
MNRRTVLATLAALPSALALAGRADAAAAAPPPAPSGHAVRPLPFDPAKLKGLSERLLKSHHENNYGGAVKNLNKVEEELARVTKDTPGYLVGGLKERELLFSNSMVLHELYFGNLGGSGKASGSIERALAKEYGSLARWEEQFRATGASLGGGSGWAILDLNFQTGALRTHWSGNHTQASAFAQPLLVMDMYEHSYALDYGAAAAKYIDAFFQNIHWDEVNRRYEASQRALAALKAPAGGR